MELYHMKVSKITIANHKIVYQNLILLIKWFIINLS